MFGIDDVDGIPGVMRVPYYNSVWSIDCPMKKTWKRAGHFRDGSKRGTSRSIFWGQRYNVWEISPTHDPVLRQITVDSIIFGRIYYVISSRIRLLCIVGEGSASDCLCLHDINSDSVKVEIQCDEIRAIWDLCGVYKHFDNRWYSIYFPNWLIRMISKSTQIKIVFKIKTLCNRHRVQ